MAIVLWRIYKDGGSASSLFNSKIDISLLQESSESHLAAVLQEKEIALKPLCEKGDFSQALILLSDLQKPIDDFFDQVMVMVEDPALRINRLRLLNKARQLFLQIADVSLLSG